MAKVMEVFHLLSAWRAEARLRHKGNDDVFRDQGQRFERYKTISSFGIPNQTGPKRSLLAF